MERNLADGGIFNDETCQYLLLDMISWTQYILHQIHATCDRKTTSSVDYELCFRSCWRSIATWTQYTKRKYLTRLVQSYPNVEQSYTYTYNKYAPDDQVPALLLFFSTYIHNMVSSPASGSQIFRYPPLDLKCFVLGHIRRSLRTLRDDTTRVRLIPDDNLSNLSENAQKHILHERTRNL
jgi:hypothetical protein